MQSIMIMLLRTIAQKKSQIFCLLLVWDGLFRGAVTESALFWLPRLFLAGCLSVTDRRDSVFSQVLVYLLKKIPGLQG